MDVQQLPSVTTPIGLGADPNGVLWGALSTGSGSILLDAAVGATVANYIAPTAKSRVKWMAAGAAATGLAGVLGLGALIGYRLLKR